LLFSITAYKNRTYKKYWRTVKGNDVKTFNEQLHLSIELTKPKSNFNKSNKQQKQHNMHCNYANNAIRTSRKKNNNKKTNKQTETKIK
jgi:hypothetical protein